MTITDIQPLPTIDTQVSRIFLEDLRLMLGATEAEVQATVKIKKAIRNWSSIFDKRNRDRPVTLLQIKALLSSRRLQLMVLPSAPESISSEELAFARRLIRLVEPQAINDIRISTATINAHMTRVHMTIPEYWEEIWSVVAALHREADRAVAEPWFFVAGSEFHQLLNTPELIADLIAKQPDLVTPRSWQIAQLFINRLSDWVNTRP